jgi:hypothetical protein
MHPEPDDLLSKADALMARHHPGRAAAAPYAEIPVLNEVVGYAPGKDDVPLLTEYAAPPQASEEQIKALAQSVRAALLDTLQPEVDALIEEHLKDALAPLVETMFEDLRAKLQSIAREILADAVHAAVEQELDRRK